MFEEENAQWGLVHALVLDGEGGARAIARTELNDLREQARSHSCSVSAAASFIRQLVRMACDPISQGGHNVFFYVILVAARGLDDF